MALAQQSPTANGLEGGGRFLNCLVTLAVPCNGICVLRTPGLGAQQKHLRQHLAWLRGPPGGGWTAVGSLSREGC